METTTTTTATTTLTDALLDDLDDLSDFADDDDNDDANEQQQHQQQVNEGQEEKDDVAEQQNNDNDNNDDAHHDNNNDNKKNANNYNNNNKSSSSTTSNNTSRKFLLDDSKLQTHLSIIRRRRQQKQQKQQSSSSSSIQVSSTGMKNENKVIDVNDNDMNDNVVSIVQQSNKHLVNLVNELQITHDELCVTYGKTHFPELEELVPNPIQYMKTVQVLIKTSGGAGSSSTAGGGGIDITRISDQLQEFLHSHQIMAISVAASTTSGRNYMSVDEIQNIQRIVSYITQIISIQDELTTYIANRMNIIAPNSCALVGPIIMAKLIGLTGSLHELAKIPSCNIQVLGQIKHNSNTRSAGGTVSWIQKNNNNNSSTSSSTTTTNNSAVTTKPHQGILMNCDLIQQCPRHMQMKALKVVAAKLALAIRCDVSYQDRGGGGGCIAGKQHKQQDMDEITSSSISASGQQFRTQILEKIMKWQEPDKAPTLKALPKPDLTIKKRRGGKRMRRLKERFEETAMMKQANTRAFSTQTGEYGDDAMGLTMGLLDTTNNNHASTAAVAAATATDEIMIAGKGGKNGGNDDVGPTGGPLRKNVEKRKMRIANTKASRKRLAAELQRQHNMQQQQQDPMKGGRDGLASSMVFTPVQGMELVNPDARRERVRQANRKWFSETAGFQSALPPSNNN